ncbi:MAG: endonuclease V [Candidatus Obscuribacterales bacterium]|nr:endonuclease V [Candidatus Obscuribacterales bacterium]
MAVAVFDVHYEGENAYAACVVADDWSADSVAISFHCSVPVVQDYQSGEFYRRELPALLAVLNLIDRPLSALVVDGYVWLSDDGRPGLGARLFEAIGNGTPVVGIAKTAFEGARFARQVLRGTSQRPLFVTAAGIDAGHAAALVASMSGPSRIPMLVKAVDTLARQGSGGSIRLQL